MLNPGDLVTAHDSWQIGPRLRSEPRDVFTGGEYTGGAISRDELLLVVAVHMSYKNNVWVFVLRNSAHIGGTVEIGWLNSMELMYAL